MTTVIRVYPRGIGDCLTALCAAEGLRHQTNDVVILETYQNNLEWLTHFSIPSTVHNDTPNPDTVYDIPLSVWDTEIQTRAKTPRHTLYADCCKTVPRLPSFHLPEKHWGKKAKDHVLLFPSSKWAVRQYPVVFWTHIEHRLKTDLGISCMALADTKERLPFKKQRSNLPAYKVIDLINNCSLCVCNDSGMAHLAGCLGKPCVVLCGPTSAEAIYDFYPQHTWLYGNLPCHECYWSHPYYNTECNTFCGDLATLDPEKVIEEITDRWSNI